VSNTIKPVGTAQVGCVVPETVGVAGVVGAAFIVVIGTAVAIQVLSTVLLTVNVLEPAPNPEKLELA
jgi:hypothetical protein